MLCTRGNMSSDFDIFVPLLARTRISRGPLHFFAVFIYDLLPFSWASGFALVKWEGQMSNTVNEMELNNMAEKLPTPIGGEFPHQPTAFKFPT